MIGRVVLAAGLAAAVGWPLPARAQAATCESLPPTGVSLQQSGFPEPVIDTSDDLAALARRARSTAPPRGSSLLLGLTTATPTASLEHAITFAPPQPGPPSRRICGVAQTVRLHIGFESPVIYVAREAARDPCLYDQVLRHEQQHVAVDRALLAHFAPRLEAEMAAAAGRLGVVRGPTPEAVEREIQRRLRVVFDGGVRTLMQERRRHQDQVDRPEEARRLGAVCGGAAMRLR